MAENPADDKQLVKAVTDARSSICKAVEALAWAYGVKTPSGKGGEDFTAIRKRVKNSADMFKKHVWPISNDFIRTIKDFLNEYYGPRVTFEEWVADLPDAVEAAKVKTVLARGIRDMYKKLGNEFHSQRNPLKDLEDKFDAEVATLNIQIGKLNKDIEGNVGWSESAGSIPIVGLFLECVFEWETQAIEDKKKLWKKIKDSNEVVLGVQAMRHGLSPAIENFGEAMYDLAGYFNVLSRELNGMSDEPEKAKKRHFKYYQELVGAIKERVDAFNAIEDAVSGKLECLPDPETKEALDKAADIWFQGLIDESKETKSLLKEMKSALKKGAEVVKVVTKDPSTWLGMLEDSGAGPSGSDVVERPTKRARNQ